MEKNFIYNNLPAKQISVGDGYGDYLLSELLDCAGYRLESICVSSVPIQFLGIHEWRSTVSYSSKSELCGNNFNSGILGDSYYPTEYAGCKWPSDLVVRVYHGSSGHCGGLLTFLEVVP